MASRLIRFFRYLVFRERDSFRMEEADKTSMRREIIRTTTATDMQKDTETATDMQKRWKEETKHTLYSVAPVPLLLYLLRAQSRAFPVTIPSFAANRSRAQGKNGTGNPAPAATSTAAKSAFSSLGMKIGAAALAVSIVGAGGVAVSRLPRFASEERVAADRHTYLVKCIEEVGDFYQAEWEETLFDDWDKDGQEDVVFYGKGQWEDEHGTLICIAGITENPYDEVSKFKTPYDDLSIYRIPTDDGVHLAYCHTKAFEKKDGNYPYQDGVIKDFKEGKVRTMPAGECIFSNPQHNAIDARYVIYNVQGEVKDEIVTTITWNGERYTGTHYVFYTADYWYGTGVLFREDEGPLGRIFTP